MTQDKKIEAQRRFLFDIFDLINELDDTCNFYDAVWVDLLHGSPQKGIDYLRARETAIHTYWGSINVLRRKMVALSERYDQDLK